MPENIQELNPRLLWKNFATLCNIPRPSKNEEKVIDFVVNFAKLHQLEYKKDEVGNVVISKPATIGYESRSTIVLQGHLDMVAQKNADTIHDFDNDPIQAYIDGEWVRARGTTLGADNGIGVAAALAILESTDLQHGPIEALFTVDEETGMTGAFNLSPDFISGRILLNLDSEDDGELFIGCAGGVNTTAIFKYTQEPVVGNAKSFQVKLTGLKGGHSGVDIHLGRGNANKIMNQLLVKLSSKIDIRITSIDGGSLSNAIPRESFVYVVVPVENQSILVRLVDEFDKNMHDEFSLEPDLKIEIATIEKPGLVIDKTTQDNLLKAINDIPDGVVRMSDNMPGIVETSSNLAIVKSSDNQIEVNLLLRSSVDSAKTELSEAIADIFEQAGADVINDGTYPGWAPNVESPILAKMTRVYNEKFGSLPEVKVVHAGLECGLIGDVYKGIDMVSFGPSIRNPHSPDEMVNIATVEKFWVYLTEILKAV
ncbi:MAG: aminoacyl-histidine dipeptidase [Candidatus Saccharimonadales bacterium]